MTHPVRPVAALAVGVLLFATACRRDAAAPMQPVALRAEANAAAVAAPAAVLTPGQRELLELAFAAASAFPMQPHAKNRGRAQDVVVAACFALGQPELALSYGQRIADWRRGAAYAEFARHEATAGRRERALQYVELARDVVRAERSDPNAQAWRADLIAAKVARALAEIGDRAAASAAVAGVDASSAHAVDDAFTALAADRVAHWDEAQAKREFAALDQAFATLPLGEQAAALATVVALHDRFFAVADLRAACEERLATTWHKVAPSLRLPAQAQLVRQNHAHGDTARARVLLAGMRDLVAAHRWRAEDRLPELARLVELTAAVGDVDLARQQLAAALAEYHAGRDGIVDIYRARSLRPLALAHYAVGQPERGEELLALVLEEGMENPNARPRCDDLVDTCVAWALRGLAPGAANLARMREIQRGLGDPW